MNFLVAEDTVLVGLGYHSAGIQSRPTRTQTAITFGARRHSAIAVKPIRNMVNIYVSLLSFNLTHFLGYRVFNSFIRMMPSNVGFTHYVLLREFIDYMHTKQLILLLFGHWQSLLPIMSLVHHSMGPSHCTHPHPTPLFRILQFKTRCQDLLQEHAFEPGRLIHLPGFHCLSLQQMKPLVMK